MRLSSPGGLVVDATAMFMADGQNDSAWRFIVARIW